MSEERTIPVRLHGRYLVEPPALARDNDRRASARQALGAARESADQLPMLVGFHGYAEDAALHLGRLRSIPGVEQWLVVSVQGLHRFYRSRSSDVVASWMTRQDRELMIADNVEYIAAVIDAVSRQWQMDRPVVYAGFSQGVAMAFRMAGRGRHRTAGVVALGGDVPPELERTAVARAPLVLLGRGTHDAIYTSDKFTSDQTRLREAGVDLTVHEFDAAHEWTLEFSQAVGVFLRGFTSPRHPRSPTPP